MNFKVGSSGLRGKTDMNEETRKDPATAAFSWRTTAGYILAAVGGGLLVYGLLPLLAPAQAIAVKVDPTVKNVGAVHREEKKDLKLNLQNTSAYTVRVTGASGGCAKGGCVTTKTALPFDIPSGETKQLEIEFKASILPGNIEYEYVVYTDWVSQNAIPVTITGLVLEDESPTSAPKEDQAIFESAR